MFSVSREILLFGVTQAISGVCQLAYSWIFSESNLSISGWLSVCVGLIVAVLGLFWVVGPFIRPLGITFLGLSYGALGLFALLAGGWLYTPFFLLAIAFLVLSWGLLKGKHWAWWITLLLTAIGMLVAIFLGINPYMSIPIMGVYLFVPAIINGVYILWYLSGPNVTDFFETSDFAIPFSEIRKHTWSFITVTIMFLLLALYLANVYFSPPTNEVFSTTMNLWGTGNGGTGRAFEASRDDLLSYSYVNTLEAPVRLSLGGLVEQTSVAGSGSVEVPSTGQYWISFYTTMDGQSFSVQCNLNITLYSLRRPILQWLFLDITGAITFALLAFVPKKKTNYPYW